MGLYNGLPCYISDAALIRINGASVVPDAELRQRHAAGEFTIAGTTLIFEDGIVFVPRELTDGRRCSPEG